jgi:hypothetical protein
MLYFFFLLIAQSFRPPGRPQTTLASSPIRLGPPPATVPLSHQSLVRTQSPGLALDEHYPAPHLADESPLQQLLLLLMSQSRMMKLNGFELQLQY